MFKNSQEYNEFLRQVSEDLGSLTEAKTKVKSEQITLNEADETEIVPFDKVALFQALANMEASLSDSYASLYEFKNQSIQNAQLVQALSQLRIGVDDLLKKTTSTMSFMGLSGDRPVE